MTETFLCSVCGESHPLEDCREFDGQELCPACLEEETVICHECGSRIWQDNDAGADATHLCQRCYESYYFNCTRCGALFHMDDALYSSDDPRPRVVTRAGNPWRCRTWRKLSTNGGTGA